MLAPHSLAATIFRSETTAINTAALCIESLTREAMRADIFYDPSFGQDRMSIDDIFDGFSIDASYADSAAIAKGALFDTPMTSLQ